MKKQILNELHQKVNLWFEEKPQRSITQFMLDTMLPYIEAAEHSVHLTALRRGLAVSILFNVVLLAVALVVIGGR